MLRPREGTYVVVGILAALSLVNIIVLVVLVVIAADIRATLAGLPASSTTKAATDAKHDPASTVPVGSGARESSATQSPRTEARAAASTANPSQSRQDSREIARLISGPEPWHSSTGRENDGEVRVASEKTDTGEGADENERTEDHAGKSRSEEVVALSRPFSWTRPAELTPLHFFLHSRSPANDAVDRSLLDVAESVWGFGSDAERALARLEVEYGRGPLIEVLERARRASAPSIDFETVPSSGLNRLDQAWRGRWEGIIERIESAVSERALASLLKLDIPSSDVVFLIDVSESMRSDLDGIRSTLASLVPLATRFDQRWAFIAFRDDVIDEQGLTADPATFARALERLRAGPAGDVPEGVDRAVFEALRLGALDWRQGSRRFVLIGDAPPLFERIEPTERLLRSAHESPEAYVLDALGVVREPELMDEVPGFRAFAEATSGRAVFVSESPDWRDEIWRLWSGSGAAWPRTALD